MRPHGWTIRRLAELGHIQAGRQRSPHYTTGELRPYLRVANVLDGFINTSQVHKMQFTDTEFAVFRLEPGDVLLNEGQSLELVGRSAIYQGDPAECCFQNTLIRFRPNGDTDSSFAQYLFQYLQYNRVFSRVALRTTSIAHLGVSRFAGISVPVPPLEEQCAIAESLDPLTETVSLVRQLLGMKQGLRCALSNALLAGANRVDAARRNKWTTMRLQDLFTERVETGRSDLPLLSITGDRGVIPRTDIERRDSSNADKKSYKRIAPGDIGYNTMRMWQGVSALSDIEGIISPAYTVCVPGPEVDGVFAAHLFKYPPIINLFHRHSQGLVDDTLNLKFKAFSQIKLSIPPIVEQRRIGQLLAVLEEEYRLLRRYRDVLEQRRRVILAKLITGQFRLKEAQCA